MTPIIRSSNRSVRIADVVSIYEPESPKPIIYSMNSSGNHHSIRSRNYQIYHSPKSNHNNNASSTNNDHQQRQSFFLNKIFRPGSSKTPYNSFRRGGSSITHDDRSHNDESTQPSNSSFLIQSPPPPTVAPNEEYETSSNRNSHIDRVQLNSTTSATMKMPPSPFPSSKTTKPYPQPKKQPPPPERRKFFMDKLFTVSRMHVSEAGIIALSDIPADGDGNNNNLRRNQHKLNNNKPLIRSRIITYSIDGDTTTTNSSVGVDEDMNDMSSKEESDTVLQASTRSMLEPHHTLYTFPTANTTGVESNMPTTTTILMELPTPDQEVMEIQTDRCIDTIKTATTSNKTTTAATTTTPIDVSTAPPTTPTTGSTTPIIAPTSHQHLYQNNTYHAWMWNTALEQELPPPIVIPTSLEMIIQSKNVPKSDQDTNSSGCTNFWNQHTSSSPAPKSQKKNKSRGNEWPASYFGVILDKVTKIQCITHCADIDLGRCDDTVEDYISTPLNKATSHCSGNDHRPKSGRDQHHRLSSSAMVLNRNDPSLPTNSIYDTDEYEDELGTYDESMISASLFDIDTIDDEYTYDTTLEDDDDNVRHHYIRPNLMTNNIPHLPIHLQQSLLSDPSSAYNGGDDDDGTSFSSQNSAWV